MNRPKHHTISYIEFGVTDLNAARNFYAASFGWEFNDYGPDYSGIRSPNGEGEIGGLTPTAPPSSKGALILLYSEDLEASLESVRAAGGAITAEPYEYPGGRRFEFTDPSGNRLGVYSNVT